MGLQGPSPTKQADIDQVKSYFEEHSAAHIRDAVGCRGLGIELWNGLAYTQRKIKMEILPTA